MAIIGGGVAGLTAAHELIERDFDVTVYERRQHLGGKAASARTPLDGSGPDSNIRREPDFPGSDFPGEEFPGEHGFRFFPGWYKHIPDTMKRIPVRGRRDFAEEHVVHDHLVPTESNVLLRYERAPVPIVLHSPKTAPQLGAFVAFVRQLSNMGLPVTDLIAFLKELATFLRTPEAERISKYDRVSWWSFLDVERRSPAFQTLTVATTRTLLAAKAEKASAYTIALMAVRTLFGAPFGSDHVLDGPTSEVWIKPWELYLRGRGVKFVFDSELDAISFDGSGPHISSLRFTRPTFTLVLQQLHEVSRVPDTAGPEDLARARRTLVACRSPCVVLREGRLELVSPNDIGNYELLYKFPQNAPIAADALRLAAADDLRSFPDPGVADYVADYYLFAIPVEQMAYYVNRSTTMRSYDPSLARIVRLSGGVDWMAGIQFYFRYPVQLPQGHIVCADSEWALTAIEQTQFWKDVSLPNGVQSILSVDISEWSKKGRFLRKEAFLCTRAEIANEVWEQLKASFNRRGDTDVLRDDVLRAGQVAGSFHLDDSIVERFDRKKQAAFVEGLDRAISRQETTLLESDDLRDIASQTSDLPFVFGDRLELNVEPLLVNRPGSLALRPTAETEIDNMYLAADYVLTDTNLASMEGANEAARHAVNAILEAAGSKHAPCRTWRFEDTEVLPRLGALLSFVERLPGAHTSAQAATNALSTVGVIAERVKDNLKQIWRRHGH